MRAFNHATCDARCAALCRRSHNVLSGDVDSTSIHSVTLTPHVTLYTSAMHHVTSWFDRTRLLYAAVAVTLAVVGWRLAATAASPADAGRADAPVVRTVAASAAPVTVHVAGAVRRPGVYELPEDARVITALRRAGGPAPGAELAALNLAAPLADGQQILVPRRGAPPPAVPPGGGAAADGPIRLSTATAEQLEALDGIGPTLAERIVRFREENGPFGAVEDLLEVPGIGEARLEGLRDQVVP